jgi:hypothetical protein
VLIPATSAADDDDHATNHAEDHADADPVMDMHPNARATGAPRRWTPEEAAKLTRAVTNNSKTKHGMEYRTECATVAMLNPGQTLHSNIDLMVPGRRTGNWTPEEDTKLKDAVKCTTARIGMQSQRSWQIEQNDSDVRAGIIATHSRWQGLG